MAEQGRGLIAQGDAIEAAWAASPVGMVVADAAGAVEAMNACAEAMLNTASGAARGRPLTQLLALPAIAPDEALTVHGLRLALARGAAIVVDLHVTPLGGDGARLISLHPAARELGARLGRSRAAVGAAAILAHELKNPLAAIRGAAQLLGDGKPDPLTALIQSEVDRMTRLIDGMESFTDDRPPEREPHNVHALIGAAVAAVRAAQPALATVEAFDPSLPPVMVAHDALVQALVNLLTNAVEASADRGAITVATSYRAGVTRVGEDGVRRRLPVEVAIADEGPGPPPELAEQIFEPFVSGKARGRGLGLALVDKIVRDNGGLIRFAREGEPPRTVFRMLLPVD